MAGDHSAKGGFEFGLRLCGLKELPKIPCQQIRPGMTKDFAQAIIDAEERAIEGQLSDGYAYVIERFAPKVRFGVGQWSFVVTRLKFGLTS